MTILRTLSTYKTFALATSVVLLVGIIGIAATLKVTVDNLLYWDATTTAESWAKYVVENVADIEEIADGQQPSAESMNFFIRTQQIRNIFGFEIIDLHGNVRLVSDGAKISSIVGKIHDETAARVAKTNLPIIAVKQGTPPLRPRNYSEAYLPVVIGGQPEAIVAAYVDLTDRYDHFHKAFLIAAVALCLLSGAGASIPAIAWRRRTKEKRRADERIQFLAHHDSLTGLSNRILLNELMNAAIAALPLQHNMLALHFIDIDRFKAINDSLGHDAGDFLLKTSAERLCAVTRLGDEVARFGGDEFVLLQSGVQNREHAELFALRLVAALAAPFQFKGHEISATVSVGYAIAPADGDSADRLLKCADLALYRAKADGRNCVRGFMPEMDATLKARTELEEAIRRAISHDGFELHYQPILEVSDRRLIGFEALVRMRAEDGTLIPPLRFIPVAEELHLIGKIGAWVLREACRTAATWPKHLTIAVNVSAAQFEAGAVSQTVAAALKEAGLEANRLELEITESLLLGDKESTMAELRALKAMGVGIVMDDFGTGYSSLSYLWRFPFNKIKIDQSFMLGLDRSGQDAKTVVKTIIALGRELNMRVTVEGVETAKQLGFLDKSRAIRPRAFSLAGPSRAPRLLPLFFRTFSV